MSFQTYSYMYFTLSGDLVSGVLTQGSGIIQPLDPEFTEAGGAVPNTFEVGEAYTDNVLAGDWYYQGYYGEAPVGPLYLFQSSNDSSLFVFCSLDNSQRAGTDPSPGDWPDTVAVTSLNTENIAHSFADRIGFVLDGGNDDETLTGVDGHDVLSALGGNDSLDGGAGDDTLTGGEGNDSIRGGSGNDSSQGGEGDDIFYNNEGYDTIDGGGGTDWVYIDLTGVAADAYTVHIDQLDGVLYAIEYPTSGNDVITGVENYRISNALVSFEIFGDNGANHLIMDAGNDTLTGRGGHDTLEAGDGTDTLNGGDGDDVLIGGASENDLRDVIYGGNGNDSIDGGYGNDELRGDAGSDTIVGGFGVDDIFGGDGNDELTGQAWSDLIFGGAGDDFINGGFGFDRVNGGDDADRFFHLGVSDHGSDWIQDYDAAEGDVLQFGQAGTRDQFQVNFTETANAGTGGVEEAFVIYRPTGQILWALVDGGAQSSINLLMGGVTYDLLA